MIKIEHLAMWVKDLEGMKTFYEKYFDARAGNIYINPRKEFRSYFLSFSSGCRLEIMENPDIPENLNDLVNQNLGLIHFAISVGSKDEVDRLTEEMRGAGLKIIGEPRTTGDGYYESVILDPENNRIEITV